MLVGFQLARNISFTHYTPQPAKGSRRTELFFCLDYNQRTWAVVTIKDLADFFVTDGTSRRIEDRAHSETCPCTLKFSGGLGVDSLWSASIRPVGGAPACIDPPTEFG